MNFIIAFLLCLPVAIAGPQEKKESGYYRGVFEHQETTFAVQLFYNLPKTGKLGEEVEFHATLEPGCGKFSGNAIFTGHSLMLTTKNFLLNPEAEAEDEDDTLSVFSLQCDLDEEGTVTKARLTASDGKLHVLETQILKRKIEPEKAAGANVAEPAGEVTKENPPATSNAVKLLGDLNGWDSEELYLYNNPDIARQKNYEVAGESNAYIEEMREQLKKMDHPVVWNNTTREYQFKSNTADSK